MALEIRGEVVMTHGEYIELTKGLPPGETGGRALVAMFFGSDNVTPMDAWSALEVDCRMAAGGDKELHAIIARASSRLAAAFPGEVPPDPPSTEETDC